MKTLALATAALLTLGGAAMADNAQFVANHFAMVESGDGEGRTPMLTTEDEIISTKGSDLAAFAAEKLSNGPEDRR